MIGKIGRPRKAEVPMQPGWRDGVREEFLDRGLRRNRSHHLEQLATVYRRTRSAGDWMSLVYPAFDGAEWVGQYIHKVFRIWSRNPNIVGTLPELSSSGPYRDFKFESSDFLTPDEMQREFEAQKDEFYSAWERVRVPEDLDKAVDIAVDYVFAGHSLDILAEHYHRHRSAIHKVLTGDSVSGTLGIMVILGLEMRPRGRKKF